MDAVRRVSAVGTEIGGGFESRLGTGRYRTAERIRFPGKLPERNAFARLVAVSRQTIEEDRADVLVLGCGTLSFRAAELQEIVGVPVINPLQVALRTAEMLVACGLSHSKRSYPLPPKLSHARAAGLASAAD